MEIEQICFVVDGYMLCNLVKRNGVLTATRSGKWWRWKVPWGWKRKRKAEGSQDSSDSKKTSES